MLMMIFNNALTTIDDIDLALYRHTSTHVMNRVYSGVMSDNNWSSNLRKREIKLNFYNICMTITSVYLAKITYIVELGVFNRKKTFTV